MSEWNNVDWHDVMLEVMFVFCNSFFHPFRRWSIILLPCCSSKCSSLFFFFLREREMPEERWRYHGYWRSSLHCFVARTHDVAYDTTWCHHYSLLISILLFFVMQWLFIYFFLKTVCIDYWVPVWRYLSSAHSVIPCEQADLEKVSKCLSYNEWIILAITSVCIFYRTFWLL